jgi:hypothetical protein
MATRRISPNVVKLHWTYDVPELAACCGVHKNTVLNWKASGLEPIDGSKPIVFLGSVVRDFLRKRNAKFKRPCGPGKFYCFRCREPRVPLRRLVEYSPVTASSGILRANCEACNTVMNRRVSRTGIPEAMPGFDVKFPEPVLRLVGRPPTFVVCESGRQTAA